MLLSCVSAIRSFDHPWGDGDDGGDAAPGGGASLAADDRLWAVLASYTWIQSVWSLPVLNSCSGVESHEFRPKVRGVFSNLLATFSS